MVSATLLGTFQTRAGSDGFHARVQERLAGNLGHLIPVLLAGRPWKRGAAAPRSGIAIGQSLLAVALLLIGAARWLFSAHLARTILGPGTLFRVALRGLCSATVIGQFCFLGLPRL